jgi:hypothetical protein
MMPLDNADMVRRRIELRKNFPGGKIPEPYAAAQSI